MEHQEAHDHLRPREPAGQALESAEGAQANVFVWGGLGRASGNDFNGHDHGLARGFPDGLRNAPRVRRVPFGPAATASTFAHRVDTLQLGWAPYQHDYDTLASWIVVQGRNYTGGLYDGIECALLLRFFKGGLWVGARRHAGDRQLQAMAMFKLI